jgi:hypothetical protein
MHVNEAGDDKFAGGINDGGFGVSGFGFRALTYMLGTGWRHIAFLNLDDGPVLHKDIKQAVHTRFRVDDASALD